MDRTILKLDPRSRHLLMDVWQRLERRQVEIATAWTEAYIAAFGRDEYMGEEQPFQGHAEIVRFSVGRLKRGDLEGYLERMADLGRRLEAQGFTYDRIVLSMHLFERAVLDLLSQEYSSTEEFARVAEVLDQVSHHAMVALAISHFEAKLASLQALESVSEAALSTMDLDALLSTLLQHVTNGMAADTGAILLLEKDTKELVYRASIGAEEADLLRHRPAADDTLAQQILASNGPVSTSPDTAGSDVCEPLPKLWSGYRLGVPLRVHGQVTGVLYIGWRQPHVVSPREMQLLETMAGRAAIAIGNVRLYAESRSLATQLSEANRELRILDQMKSDFLSIISHELRTPLTSILGYAQLLLKTIHGDLTPKVRQHVTTIHENGQRLLALINDLLDFSSIEAGRITLNPKRVQLRPLLELALAPARAETSVQAIDLSVTIPAELPLVMVDEQRFKQIIGHLMSNAIKFTPSGGQIRVHADYDCPECTKTEDGLSGGVLRISVADTGIGIPPDQLERIWTRFYQVEDAATRRFGGTGLGLAVVKTLVELHGGRVWVESEGIPGKGSTFSFTLPVGD